MVVIQGVILCFALLLSTSCSRSVDPVAEVSSGPRFLFIGNSLTSTHDIPGLVESMSAAAGKPIEARSVVIGGASLEDHWNSGSAVSTLTKGDWDFVILQQGPSSLPESQDHLRLWTTKFATLIQKDRTKIALYMVWPEQARSFAFPAVHTSYSNAANAVGGIFVPSGDAWRSACATNPQTQLYGPDGFHPSMRGAYLAALVLTATLLDVTPDAIPGVVTTKAGIKYSYAGTELAALRLAAARAITQEDSWPDSIRCSAES